jgi:hypothetical protein
VDLERRQVADLLAECSAASFEGWLRQHPGVTIISRDRQGLLAEGGRKGAPEAEQVADLPESLYDEPNSVDIGRVLVLTARVVRFDPSQCDFGTSLVAPVPGASITVL